MFYRLLYDIFWFSSIKLRTKQMTEMGHQNVSNVYHCKINI